MYNSGYFYLLSEHHWRDHFQFKKKHKTFIYITVNIYNILSFEELSFQSTLIRNYFYLLIFTCPRTGYPGKSTCQAVGHGNSTLLRIQFDLSRASGKWVSAKTDIVSYLFCTSIILLEYEYPKLESCGGPLCTYK